MESMIQEEFAAFCQDLVTKNAPNTVTNENYLTTVRKLFHDMNDEIKRLAAENPHIDRLAVNLKEIAWYVLEKYRDDFLLRESIH